MSEPDYFFDDEYDQVDDDAAIEDCGYDPDYPGICWAVGTEHCSFFCPLHEVYFED